MRPLGDIIQAVKEGQKPDYEELRYALLVLDMLGNLSSLAIRKLAEAQRTGKKLTLTNSPIFQEEEDFNRRKTALNKDPKSFLGRNNDPENPEYRKRFEIGLKVFEKMVNKEDPQKDVEAYVDHVLKTEFKALFKKDK